MTKSKYINELPILEAMTEETKVVVEENGETKRLPASAIVPAGVVTEEQLTEQLEAVEQKIPTDYVTFAQLEEVSGAIPTDTVSTEQLEEAMNEVKEEIPEGFSGSWNDLTDRPFGDEISEIIYENEAEGLRFIDDHSYKFGHLGTLKEWIDFRDGQNQYRVTIDGKSWVVNSYEHSNGIYIILQNYEGEGYPTEEYADGFQIANELASTYITSIYLPPTYGDTVSLKIEHIVSPAVPIPEELIPAHTHSYDEIENVPETVTSWHDLTDKPFYEEETVCVSMNGFEFAKSGLIPASNVVVGMIMLNIGDKYTVIFDGVEYEAVVDEAYKIVSEPITFIDLFMGYFGTSGYELSDTINLGIHDVVLYRRSIVPLPEKYLPENAVKFEDLSWDNINDKPFYEGGEIDKVFISGTVDQLLSQGGDEVMDTMGLFSTATELIIQIEGEKPFLAYKQDLEGRMSGSGDIYRKDTDEICGRYTYTQWGDPLIVQLDISINNRVGKNCTVATSKYVHKDLDEKFLPTHAHKWEDIENPPFGEERRLYETIADNVTITLVQKGETYVGADMAGSMFQSILGTAYFGAGKAPLTIDGERSEWSIDYVLTINGIDFHMEKKAGQSNTVYTMYSDNKDVEITVNRGGSLSVHDLAFVDEEWTVSMKIYIYKTTPLDPKYLPKAESVSDVTEAPTAEQFNALLSALRSAGYMN